ncbi:MAG: cytochrome C oxidase subunit IV family protein [Polyangiaceae bacterium]|nr:cytochrome C oxidase subunit IV family protein [Polyangiaceae bacterium]
MSSTEASQHDHEAEPAAPDGGHGGAGHGDAHYVRIWALLVALLVVSVVGPMLGHVLVTLLTAFGIALVKAYLVARHFMHLGIERRWVGWMLLAMVAFVGLFFAGTAPDVMKHEGYNWRNEAAEREVKRALEAAHGAGSSSQRGAAH